MRKKVLVLGSNFGGLTAALAVNQELHGDVNVRVLSPSERFVFNPSLIWLPFGNRKAEDITFEVGPTFEAHGIDFVHSAAVEIDADRKRARCRREGLPSGPADLSKREVRRRVCGG